MEIEGGGMAEEAADWFSRSFQLEIFGKKIDAAAAKQLLGLAYVSSSFTSSAEMPTLRSAGRAPGAAQTHSLSNSSTTQSSRAHPSTGAISASQRLATAPTPIAPPWIATGAQLVFLSCRE